MRSAQEEKKKRKSISTAQLSPSKRRRTSIGASETSGNCNIVSKNKLFAQSSLCANPLKNKNYNRAKKPLILNVKEKKKKITSKPKGTYFIKTLTSLKGTLIHQGEFAKRNKRNLPGK
jgi:hypothetical protein